MGFRPICVEMRNPEMNCAASAVCSKLHVIITNEISAHHLLLLRNVLISPTEVPQRFKTSFTLKSWPEG